MRISDWSSDVCSSDLLQWTRPSRRKERPQNQARLAKKDTSCTRLNEDQQPGPVNRHDQRAIAWSTFRQRCLACGAASDQSEIAVCRSEEHTSELQSLMRISYAVFCLNKKHKDNTDILTIILKE